LAGVGLSGLESFGQSGFDYPAEAMRQRYNRTGNPADAWSAFILQGVANGHHRYEQGEMEREELIKRLQELERQKGNQGNYSPSTPLPTGVRPSQRPNPARSIQKTVRLVPNPFYSEAWLAQRASLPVYTNVLDKKDEPLSTHLFSYPEELKFNPNVRNIYGYSMYCSSSGDFYKVEHGEEYFRFLAEHKPKFFECLKREYYLIGFHSMINNSERASGARVMVGLIDKVEAEQAAKPKNPLKVVGNFFRGCLFGGR
jgi:hypothetical protein